MRAAWTLVAFSGSLALVAGASSARGQGLVPTSSTSAGAVGDHRVLIESLQGRLDVLASRLGVVEDQVGLLRETALGGEVAETRAILVHKNELGGSFVIERAKYVLDGAVLIDKVDANGSLASVKEMVLFDGQIGAGDHLLEVEILCRGGSFGLFSYVESYRFRVTSRYLLRVREGRTNRLDVIAYQRPDITLDTAKRLTIRYDRRVTGASGDEAPDEGS